MLQVKKLHPNAILPTVAHPGDDLGFDLYALEDTVLYHGAATKVRTGISAVFEIEGRKFGLLVEDRSSMALKGIRKSAGVVDAGYRGELQVILTNYNGTHTCRVEEPIPGGVGQTTYWYADGYRIKAGDKIAQILPQEVFTGTGVGEVNELEQSTRGVGGFGSSGR